MAACPASAPGTNPAPRLVATAPPRMKPRASMPTTWVTSELAERIGHGLDDRAEQPAVAEHRRDVLEDDARLRVVGNRPQRVEDVAGQRRDDRHRMSKLLVGTCGSSRASCRSTVVHLRVGRAARAAAPPAAPAPRLVAGRDDLDPAVGQVARVARQAERRARAGRRTSGIPRPAPAPATRNRRVIAVARSAAATTRTTADEQRPSRAARSTPACGARRPIARSTSPPWRPMSQPRYVRMPHQSPAPSAVNATNRPQRHARHPGGNRDQVPDDRQQPARRTC